MEHSFRSGLTASVIGSQEEQPEADPTDRRQQHPVRGRKQRFLEHGKQSVSVQYQQRRNKSSTQIRRAEQEEWIYRLQQNADRKKNESPVRGKPGLQQDPGAVRQKRSGDNLRTIPAGNKSQAPRVFTGGTAKGSNAAAGVAAKGSKAAVGAAKHAAKKGAATTAAVASGAATAGTSTAVFAVGSAVESVKRAAKRAADRAMEAMEASYAARKASAGTSDQSVPGLTRKKSGGKGLWLAGAAAFVLAIPMILFLMIYGMVLVPLASYQPTLPVSTGGVQIVAVAEQELSVSDQNVGGYKYKSWYGMDDNWCAMFVSWCANECGYLDAGIMPKTASVANMKSWYEQQGLYHTKESGYEPKAGDVVIFLNGKSHTGLVVSYDPEARTITTIEGNTGTSGTSPYHKGSHVKERSYALSYSAISGYGSPQYPDTSQ